MIKPESLLAVGLSAAALTGCGHNSTPSQPAHRVQPQSYDVSRIDCGDAEALQGIEAAIRLHVPLTAQGLRAENSGEDIVALSRHGSEIEIADPVVLTCKGLITNVIGIDRGFYGNDTPKLRVATADKVDFYTTPLGKGFRKIARTSISRYVHTDTMIDKGPAKAGVSGLTSTSLKAGYAIMP